MKRFQQILFKRPLICYLVLFFSLVPGWPAPSGASFIPSQGSMSSPDPSVRQQDLQKIQALLEKKVVSQKLEEFGLTPEEVNSRLSQLNDEEIHRIASRIDELQAGGDAVGLLIGLLVIVLLVILILYLLKEVDIEVKKKIL
ncbi:MAG: PA2779 family protein [Deltaproteobacteria bacterium]|nr:MAG: PA2779 family protein [Deltaproteobacteria bacterium]